LAFWAARTEVTTLDNRQIIDRYIQALEARDIGMQADLLHPEVTVRYPQSGEVVRGAQNYVRRLKSFPEGLPEGRAT
jgi:hypothetical protein